MMEFARALASAADASPPPSLLSVLTALPMRLLRTGATSSLVLTTSSRGAFGSRCSHLRSDEGAALCHRRRHRGVCRGSIGAICCRCWRDRRHWETRQMPAQDGRNPADPLPRTHACSIARPDRKSRLRRARCAPHRRTGLGSRARAKPDCGCSERQARCLGGARMRGPDEMRAGARG